ncbi:MAG: glycosyltransferase 87 family protein, partial [Actinomycetota bacterium]
MLVATVGATPGSPFQPVLPAAAQPWGPFRWLAGLMALDALGDGALVAVAVFAMAFAAVAFVFVLREAWRGTISPQLVIGLAVAYHVVVLLLPLLFSRDVYSYAYYGRIAGIRHANPYVATPSDYPNDALWLYVGPRWVDTPAVYGPLFTMLSSLVVRIFDNVTALIVAFRLIAAAASLATIAIVVKMVRDVRPGREAFAVALIGLNPVVLFQSVASGHNDLLVALSVAGGVALVFARRDLLATAVLALGALVKATAAVPLLLLIVAAAA